jgi:hypothetical protein
MNPPKRDASDEEWFNWVNSVAPYRGLCDRELPEDMRFLSGISDREIAAVSARGLVATLRKRGVIR